jgi:hypothetical protein
MPRNSSGTYSLPAGNPVVTQTVISSTWANNTLSDLSSAMTDSLSRSGDGAMLAPLELLDGDASTPSLTFETDPDTGLYQAADNTIGFATGGTAAALLTNNQFTVQGTAPRYAIFENDAATDEGRWRLLASAGDLFLQARDDADAAGNPVFVVTRTGTTVDSITFTASDITLDAGDDITVDAAGDLALIGTNITFTGAVVLPSTTTMTSISSAAALTLTGATDVNIIATADDVIVTAGDAVSITATGLASLTGDDVSIQAADDVTIDCQDFGVAANWTLGFNSSSNGALNVDTGTTVGAAGAASALPAQPTGYLIIVVNGTSRRIPFYAEP